MLAPPSSRFASLPPTNLAAIPRHLMLRRGDVSAAVTHPLQALNRSVANPKTLSPERLRNGGPAQTLFAIERQVASLTRRPLSEASAREQLAHHGESLRQSRLAVTASYRRTAHAAVAGQWPAAGTPPAQARAALQNLYAQALQLLGANPGDRTLISLLGQKLGG